MQKVLVIAGTKQAGKSTAAKYITALRMQQAGNLRRFEIDKDGDLLVSSAIKTENGVEEGFGVLDLYRTDEEFAKYAYEKIWPYTKIYSFANYLKDTAINIFSLNPKNIYGTDEDKGALTQIKWSKIWPLLSKNRQDEITASVMKEWNLTDEKDVLDKYLSHRAFLQEFGSLCRQIDPDCWTNACWRDIKYEGFPYVIIDDCRYENEVDISNQNGAKILLLDKQLFKDSHASEQIHKVKKSKFHFILKNETMTLDEKHAELRVVLEKFGWNLGELQS